MGVRTRPGRGLVVAVIVATLTMALLADIVSLLMRGPAQLPQQLVRFALTVVLCVFLYRGAAWARWVSGVLFALGSVVSLVGGIAYLSTNTASLLLLLLGAVYAACAVVLLFIPTVREYFGVENVHAG